MSSSSTLAKNLLLTESGRPPWYNTEGQAKPCFVIGIAGGSASGKTRVANEILKKLAVPWVLVISQDSFYKSLDEEESKKAFANQHDFDSPNAFDYDKLRECIADLRGGRSVEIPIYSFKLHQRMNETQYLYGATIIIVEGIFVLYDELTRALLDLKIFVQCDSDLMLARRIRRDTLERGRDVQGILDQYLRFVKPSFDYHVLPTSRYADIMIPGEANATAIDLITTHIRKELSERSFQTRTQLSISKSQRQSSVLPSNLHVLRQETQLLGIHTILRDENTTRDDLVFYANRLGRMLIEESMHFLPLRPKTITTKIGHRYEGTELDTENLCAFTILRSGEILERAVRRVLGGDVPLASALIQSDPTSGEPLLYSLSFPDIIKNRRTAQKAHVLLLDSQIGTGAAALMALRILLDHGVQQQNILVVVYVVSQCGGIRSICDTFPGIRILTSAVDPDLEQRMLPMNRLDAAVSRPSSRLSDLPNDAEDKTPQEKKVFCILPGIGSFGDRFFGT